jgi:hypothetical protein
MQTLFGRCQGKDGTSRYALALTSSTVGQESTQSDRDVEFGEGINFASIPAGEVGTLPLALADLQFFRIVRAPRTIDPSIPMTLPVLST